MANVSKARELKHLIGQFVQITLKDVKVVEFLQEHGVTGIEPYQEGYVVDVSSNYLYLGENTEEFTQLIEIDSFDQLKIVEPIPEELKVFAPPGEDIH